jgi:outer membrane scaffolding protein for murein synthesis (MipA/OmpV family)
MTVMNRSPIFWITAALLAGAATLYPGISQAGSCCGGASAGALTVPRYASAVADLSVDVELYDGFWNQNGRHTADPPGSDLRQYRLNVGYARRFLTDWTASIALPYVWNDNSYSGLSSRSNGMGDTSLALTYDLVEDKSAWRVYDLRDLIPAVTVGLGLLVPTGISPYDDVTSSFDVTGRGFYRVDGTLLIEKTIQPWSASLAVAYGTHPERAVNREYGRYVAPYHKELGDRFSSSLTLSRSFYLGTGGDTLMATASYAFLHEDNARYDGERAADSGFAKQSLGATLAYSSTDHDWGVRLGWNHALQQNGWGKNFPTTDILTLGVRYVFR